MSAMAAQRYCATGSVMAAMLAWGGPVLDIAARAAVAAPRLIFAKGEFSQK